MWPDARIADRWTELDPPGACGGAWEERIRPGTAKRSKRHVSRRCGGRCVVTSRAMLSAQWNMRGCHGVQTLFPDYKKNRRPMPDDLRSALGQIVSRFLAQGVGTVSVPGFEADDLIASIAQKVSEAGGRATVLSTDKSFCQLISNSVSVYDHFAAQDRDTEYVRQRFGVEPERLADLFALAGDSSLYTRCSRDWPSHRREVAGRLR